MHCPENDEVTMRKSIPFLDSTLMTLFAISAFTLSLPQPAHADHVTPPPVPDDIQVPAGNKAFLVGHAVGTQNYVCLPSGAGFAYTLFTPQATLFDDNDKQIITHFFSPNPFEPNTNPRVVANGTIRATWQHLETRAPSGPRRTPPTPPLPPPTPISSSRVPLPGSCLRWLEPKTDPPVATR